MHDLVSFQSVSVNLSPTSVAPFGSRAASFSPGGLRGAALAAAVGAGKSLAEVEGDAADRYWFLVAFKQVVLGLTRRG